LGEIGEAALHASGLPRIAIPASVVVLRAKCLSQCGNLAAVEFAVPCALERIELGTFGPRPVTLVNYPAPGVIEYRTPAPKRAKH
jgi:hypothetical protein